MAIFKSTTKTKTNPFSGAIVTKNKKTEITGKPFGNGMSVKIKEKEYPKNFTSNPTVTQTKKKNIFGTTVIKTVAKNADGKIMDVTKAKYKNIKPQKILK